MKKLFFFILLSLQVLAIDSNKSKIFVISADKKIKVDHLKGKKNIEAVSYEETRPNRRLGSIGQTNKLFEHQIIQSKKLNWDVLERDLFYLKLQDYPIKELRKKFPQFSNSDLKILKESIR
jgi:hypothetical protein